MASATGVSIKEEPGLDEDIQARIISLCEEHPQGINGDMLKNAMPHAKSHQYVTALNALLKAERIKVFKKKIQGKDELLYRLQDVLDDSSAVKGGDHQEKLVYKIISDASNKGIWVRDIRKKTNIPMSLLKKMLKNMESKKFIKAVQSVAESRKKLYMVFDTEPDISITGGAWYNDSKFDHEFADILSHQCFRFLEEKAAAAKERFSDNEPLAQYNAGLAATEEVHKYITQLGISAVPLSEKDIKEVLHTLVWDGKAKEVSRVGASCSKDEDGSMYRMARPLAPTTGLMDLPCGYCKLIGECRDGGTISPQTCVYMKEWMDKIDF